VSGEVIEFRGRENNTLNYEAINLLHYRYFCGRDEIDLHTSGLLQADCGCGDAGVGQHSLCCNWSFGSPM
jgi:hypothetical protein